MAEKRFVDALMKTVTDFGQAVAYRSSDSYTMGIPDVIGYIPVDVPKERIGYHVWSQHPLVWAIAIEAKELHPLMEDPFHKGRRTGQMLKHPFTGPQVSTLRKMKIAGVDAFGLVRASSDTAFRIEPEKISAKTGNFTHEELMKIGHVVRRENGVWRFWEAEKNEVLGSRHRDDS